MYELKHVLGNTYYIESPAKIGLIKLNGTEAVLIDSGNDKEAGKKALRHVEACGCTLKAVYNTHSNADHIGGNALLQSRTGCKIYANGAECAFTQMPRLESTLLFGANPPKELRGKFLMAQESPAEPLTTSSLPNGFEIIPLPGHFVDMIGFRTPDDVVFLADCLSSKETVEKYKIGFIYDVAAYLETLESVKTMKAAYFVPSHAMATDDISELAQYNIDAVKSIADRLCELSIAPVTFETLLKRVFEDYGLTMTFEQHALVGSTVRSYLTYLSDLGRISAKIEDNTVFWQTV